MKDSTENAKLHISFKPDSGRPMVQLYGNPEGLRQLAAELVRIANLDQSGKDEHDPVVHFHYTAKTSDWIIRDSVEEIQTGMRRMRSPLEITCSSASISLASSRSDTSSM